jgi:predicted SAM-dependent methyltransferase
MQSIKLNLGCGNQLPDSWINVDYSLGAMLAKYPLFSVFNSKLKIFNLSWHSDIFIHDLRKKFPWSNEEVDIIYSSHTLEHLNKHQGLHFLKECHRVLKKDGILRIVVPDLKAFVSAYIEGDILAEDFVEKLGVLYEEGQNSTLKSKLAVFIRFPHQCMYDTESLIRIMSNVGFECREKQPFESEIPDIKNIELPDRTIAAVIVEGKKL